MFLKFILRLKCTLGFCRGTTLAATSRAYVIARVLQFAVSKLIYTSNALIVGVLLGGFSYTTLDKFPTYTIKFLS